MNLNILLQSADGYLQAGKVLYSTYSTKEKIVSYFSSYISPCTANCAFACELYLKYLYYVEHSKELGKHDLNVIFEKLSLQVQDEIRNEYGKWTSLLPLDECLKVHNRVFIDFRYLYEGKTDVKYAVEPQSLYNLMISLHNVCYMKKEATDDAH